MTFTEEHFNFQLNLRFLRNLIWSRRLQAAHSRKLLLATSLHKPWKVF